MVVIGLSIEFDNGEVLMFPNGYVDGDCSLGFCGKEEKIDVMDNDGAEYYRAEAIKISIDRDIRGVRDKIHDGVLAHFYRDYGKSDTPHDELLEYLFSEQSCRYIRSFQRIIGHKKEDVIHMCAWGGEDEHINPYQRIKTNKHGDLFIAIGEDMTLLDRAYPDDEINADDYEVCCFHSLGRSIANKWKI